MRHPTFIRLAASAILGLATVASAPACFAGAVGGPKIGSTDVEAHDSDSYAVNFRGGELAVVEIRGDGDTTLIARVYDENGNVVDTDSDGDGTGVVLLRWVPRWTGQFTIRIFNRGSVYNHYVIRTN